MAFPRVTGFAPVCQSSMAEAVCLSSTSVLSEKPPSVCAYQCSTGRCSCTSQAPLKTISALFESGFLGNSMLRQKIHWAVLSTPQVEGKCSVAESKGWVFPARVSMEVCSDQAADPCRCSRQTNFFLPLHY